MFSLRLHVGGERREAQQPHVAGGPGPGRDPAVPGEGQGRPQGAVAPGETPSSYTRDLFSSSAQMGDHLCGPSKVQ